MAAESSNLSPDYRALLAETRLPVVIVYEDFETAVKVRDILRHVLADAAKDIASIAGFWKFELLAYPPLFEQATTEATDAEFIILSVHGSRQLPPPVLMWIERWTAERTKPPRLLLALLDESTEHSATANNVLARLNSMVAAKALEWTAIFSDSGDVPVFISNGETRGETKA